MYTLVVIDMQSEFESACSKKNPSRHRTVLSNIKEALKKAIQDKASIIFVEYSDCDGTNPELTKITEGYEQVTFVTKHDDDGSREVYKAIWKNKSRYRRIKVCGVNTECCVYMTVQGLSCKLQYSIIEVLANSCNSSMDHNIGIFEMDKEPNVVINRE